MLLGIRVRGGKFSRAVVFGEDVFRGKNRTKNAKPAGIDSRGLAWLSAVESELLSP
jgi:hypothetical protein